MASSIRTDDELTERDDAGSSLVQQDEPIFRSMAKVWGPEYDLSVERTLTATPKATIQTHLAAPAGRVDARLPSGEEPPKTTRSETLLELNVNFDVRLVGGDEIDSLPSSRIDISDHAKDDGVHLLLAKQQTHPSSSSLDPSSLSATTGTEKLSSSSPSSSLYSSSSSELLSASSSSDASSSSLLASPTVAQHHYHDEAIFSLQVNASRENRLFGRQASIRAMCEHYFECNNHSDDVRYDDARYRTGDCRRRQPKFVLVTGQSGTGKTALVTKGLKPVVIQRDNGLFLVGKCHPNHSPTRQGDEAAVRDCESLSGKGEDNEPLAPFVAALSSLIEQALTPQNPLNNDDTDEHEHEHERYDLLRHLQRALPSDATEEALLVEVLPVLSKVLLSHNHRRSSLGSVSTDMDPLGGSNHEGMIHLRNCKDGDNPTISAIVKFLKELCSFLCAEGFSRTGASRPIVLMLDDLQWMDPMSLMLLQRLLLEPQLSSLMIIGTCRGNEVSVGHDLSVTLRELETNKITIDVVELGNLQPTSTQEYVEDLMRNLTTSQAEELSALVHQETAGNPFSIQQFLWAMYEQDLLYYSKTAGAWQYDLQDMQTSIMLQRHVTSDDHDDDDRNPSTSRVCWTSGWLHRLPEVAKDIMKVASCLGTVFELQHILMILQDRQEEDILQAIGLLKDRGLLLETSAPAALTANTKVSLSWAHDRFQQASYELISDGDKTLFHASIGFRLYRWLSESQLEEHVFMVANHMLKSTSTVVAVEEREEVAHVCLMAGRKAALASAFDVSFHYFNMGIRVLGTHAWTCKQYDLTLILHSSAAEMACCIGDTTNVDRLVEAILSSAANFDDKLRAYETKIYSLTARQNQQAAATLGLQVLRQLGDLPKKCSPREASKELQRTRKRLKRKSDQDILSLPALLKDAAAAIAFLRITHVVIPSVFRSCPQFAPVIASRAIKLTLEKGLHPMACSSFAAIGMVICNQTGEYEEGRRLFDLSVQIMERFKAGELKCRSLCFMHGFCTPYLQPIRQCLEPLAVAARAGTVTGDVDVSCVCLYLNCWGSFLAGNPLQPLLEKIDACIRHAANVRQEAPLRIMTAVKQMVLNFIGQSQDPRRLGGEAFDSCRGVDSFQKGGDKLAIQIFRLFQCLLAVYFQDFRLAYKLSSSLRECTNSCMNAFAVPQALFLDGMAEINMAGMSSTSSSSPTTSSSSPSSAPADGTTKRRPLRKRFSKFVAGSYALRQLRKLNKYSTSNVLNKIYLLEAERHVLSDRIADAMIKYEQSIQVAKEEQLLQEQALACHRAALALSKGNYNHNTRTSPLASSSGIGPGNERHVIIRQSYEYFMQAKSLYIKWGSVSMVEQIHNDMQQRNMI